MKPDDLICYCYRVPLRKLVNYARRERPARASQMSQCLDAGTGCGWCIPFLTRIQQDPDGISIEVDAATYEEQRRVYRETGASKNEF